MYDFIFRIPAKFLSCLLLTIYIRKKKNQNETKNPGNTLSFQSVDTIGNHGPYYRLYITISGMLSRLDPKMTEISSINGS